MKLPLRAHFGWKYLESLQKKDASQGLNMGGNTHFLKFCASKFSHGQLRMVWQETVIVEAGSGVY